MKLQMNSRHMMWIHAGTFTAVSLFMLASFSVDYVRNQEKTAQAISPELYNSAYAPVGKSGGKIIPASCSIGEPSDAADGFAPCPAPQVSINPLSATAVGGGFVNWSYNATNANNCDLSTTMSSTNMGPAYSFIGGAISNTYNAGAFANASGWVRYTVTCWDAPHINSGSNSILITTTLNPKVDVVFSTNGESPFLAINSFAGTAYDEISGELSWSVSGATSCTATGPSGWSGSTISRPTGSRFVSYTGSGPTIRHYTLSCTNGTDTLSRTASIYFEGTEVCGGTTGINCN